MDEYKKYEPIFGSWYLGKLLGKGSFGKVFEITREEFGTTYRSALKIITIPQDDDDVKARMTEGPDLNTVSEYYEGILKEIINENEIMAQLKGNSNIVSYEDHQIIPHDDGIGYDILIRMELLTPLLDRMVERRLDEKEVVKLGIDMCKALELCHKKNIIHRDIKPQNIFISDNGDFKLGDFGIARTMEKTTGGMSKKGTYKYMAPEVFKGEHYDSTVDIYSLGIVLYSLLNGNRGPFLPAPPAKVTHNDEEEARMRRFRGEPLPAPRDAGAMLAYIIQKASAADPSLRYHTAEQMRRDLESYLINYNDTAAQIATGYQDERTVLDEKIRANTGLSSAGYVRPEQAGFDPMKGQARNIQSGKTSGNKILPIIIIGVLVLVVVGGLLIFINRSNVKDPDAALADEQPSGSYLVSDKDDVSVLSSDWDWDSSTKDQASGLRRVDTLFWVRNDSDHDITGIEYDVYTKKGKLIENAKNPESPMVAYGYIASGKTGIMAGEAWTKKKLRPDDGTYVVKSYYANDSMSGYVVPYGSVMNYGNGNNNYDAIIENPNDEEVSANSNLIMIMLDDKGKIRGEGNGRMSGPIPAGVSKYVQELAFYDPGVDYAKPEEMSVYVIDVDKYEINK